MASALALVELRCRHSVVLPADLTDVVLILFRNQRLDPSGIGAAAGRPRRCAGASGAAAGPAIAVGAALSVQYAERHLVTGGGRARRRGSRHDRALERFPAA